MYIYDWMKADIQSVEFKFLTGSGNFKIPFSLVTEYEVNMTTEPD